MIPRLLALFASVRRRCLALLGSSTQAPMTERDFVGAFLDFLEDRRVLYSPYFIEFPSHVLESVEQIITESGETLARLPAASQASAPIRAIRSACHAFLARAEIIAARASASAIPGNVLFFGVVELQKALARHAAALAEAFALEMPTDLATMAFSAAR